MQERIEPRHPTESDHALQTEGIQPTGKILHPTYSEEKSIETRACCPGQIVINGSEICLGGSSQEKSGQIVRISLESGEVTRSQKIPTWETQIELGGGARACFRFDDLTVIDRHGGRHEFPQATAGDNLAVDAFRVADGEILFRAGNVIKQLKLNANDEVTIETPMRNGTFLADYNNFIGIGRNEKVILTGWDNGAVVAILERGNDGKYSFDKKNVSPGPFTINAADILPDGRLVTAVSTTLQVNRMTHRKPDWKYEFKSETRELLDREIFSLAASGDGGIVCGHRNGEVTVLRPNESGSGWTTESLLGHKAEIDSVKILRDGRIISADRSGVVKIWG